MLVAAVELAGCFMAPAETAVPAVWVVRLSVTALVVVAAPVVMAVSAG